MMVCVLCKSSRVGKVTGHDSLLITIRLKVSILITSSAQSPPPAGAGWPRLG